MDAARQALRQALKNLTPQPDQILEGVYSSQVDEFFDVENVVIYNIEPAAFRNSSQNGLRARRNRSQHSIDHSLFSHTLHYHFIPKPQLPSEMLVHLRFTPTGFQSVFDVWWAASKGNLIKASPIQGRFGLRVDLYIPVLPKNPASRIKILFDGIIAAIQNNLVPPTFDTVKILSQKHCVDAQFIYAQMCKPIFPAISSLRSIPLIRPFGAGVQWHPADDLCEDCILTVNQSNQLYCDAYFYSLPN